MFQQIAPLRKIRNRETEWSVGSPRMALAPKQAAWSSVERKIGVALLRARRAPSAFR